MNDLKAPKTLNKLRRGDVALIDMDIFRRSWGFPLPVEIRDNAPPNLVGNYSLLFQFEKNGEIYYIHTTNPHIKEGIVKVEDGDYTIARSSWKRTSSAHRRLVKKLRPYVENEVRKNRLGRGK